jgi:hypothetical protein
MVLIPLSCTVQEPMLVTLSWHLDSMVNYMLLNLKTDGTGQDMEFKEINTLNGLNGPRMLTSMLLTYL